eukprot:4058864-Pyramimonas_sp.AAC.1
MQGRAGRRERRSRGEPAPSTFDCIERRAAQRASCRSTARRLTRLTSGRERGGASAAVIGAFVVERLRARTTYCMGPIGSARNFEVSCL